MIRNVMRIVITWNVVCIAMCNVMWNVMRGVMCNVRCNGMAWHGMECNACMYTYTYTYTYVCIHTLRRRYCSSPKSALDFTAPFLLRPRSPGEAR